MTAARPSGRQMLEDHVAVRFCRESEAGVEQSRGELLLFASFSAVKYKAEAIAADRLEVELGAVDAIALVIDQAISDDAIAETAHFAVRFGHEQAGLPGDDHGGRSRGCSWHWDSLEFGAGGSPAHGLTCEIDV